MPATTHAPWHVTQSTKDSDGNIMTATPKTLFNSASIRLFAAAVGVAMLFGPSALAQQAQPTQQGQAQRPKLVEAGKHGDWTIRCTEQKTSQNQATQPAQNAEGKGDLATNAANTAQAAQRPQCVMIQIARHPKQQNVGISVLVIKQVVKGKAVSQIRVTVPIGVYLPAGVGVEIDGSAIGRFGYELCSPQGVCVATAFLNDDLLGKFKSGGASKFYIKDVRGRDGIFDLSLKGFTKAYESL